MSLQTTNMGQRMMHATLTRHIEQPLQPRQQQPPQICQNKAGQPLEQQVQPLQQLPQLSLQQPGLQDPMDHGRPMLQSPLSPVQLSMPDYRELDKSVFSSHRGSKQPVQNSIVVSRKGLTKTGYRAASLPSAGSSDATHFTPPLVTTPNTGGDQSDENRSRLSTLADAVAILQDGPLANLNVSDYQVGVVTFVVKISVSFTLDW